MSTRLTEAREKAARARQQIENAQKEMAEAIEGTLKEGFGALFDEYPFLGSVAWSQYTPYFNDGEPCVFHSQFTYPSINSVKDLEDDTAVTHGDESGEDFYAHSSKERYAGYVDGRSVYEPNEGYDPQYEACEQAIRDFVKSVAGDEKRTWNSTEPTTFDSALLHAFGDHATVIVTREGIEVDECSHD